MTREMRVLVVGLAILVTLASLPITASGQADLTPLADDNAAFAFDLYEKLRETEGNLFFSPYSISTALAMTYAGARGQTEKEMAEVLHFTPDQEALHQAFMELQAHMNAIQNKGHVQLSIANSLWPQKGYPFLDSFLDLNKKYYGAGLHFTDFAGQTEAARQAINTWVEDETNEKIKDLIKPGVLDDLTRLVLCNAIYFKGDWACQFDEKRTRDADFFITKDETVTVPLMNREIRVSWKEFGGFSALELPYEGDDLSMVIFLPKEVDGLPRLERALTDENVRAWMQDLAQARTSEVIVELPRFQTTCEFELNGILGAMGMPSAFGSRADLSGMTKEEPLYISNVIHKAFVDVNEEGTEAAAATAVVTKAMAIMEVKRFRADHPFVFLIRENQTGSILFLGRIVDPSA